MCEYTHSSEYVLAWLCTWIYQWFYHYSFFSQICHGIYDIFAHRVFKIMNLYLNKDLQ